MPELNTSCPLTPATPAFAVRIVTEPLLDAVPSPVSRLIAPPVCTVLDPDSTPKRPPEPLLPLPDARSRRRFRTTLLTWYRVQGRDLPWSPGPLPAPNGGPSER